VIEIVMRSVVGLVHAASSRPLMFSGRFVAICVWINVSESGGCPNVKYCCRYLCLYFFAVGALSNVAVGSHPELTFLDKTPQRYEMKARASQIDPRAKPHPEIEFLFEKDGKPQDFQNAVVDTRVTPQGKLVIWLMGHSPPLFERVSGYGLHAI